MLSAPTSTRALLEPARGVRSITAPTSTSQAPVLPSHQGPACRGQLFSSSSLPPYHRTTSTSSRLSTQGELRDEGEASLRGGDFSLQERDLRETPQVQIEKRFEAAESRQCIPEEVLSGTRSRDTTVSAPAQAITDGKGAECNEGEGDALRLRAESRHPGERTLEEQRREGTLEEGRFSEEDHSEPKARASTLDGENPRRGGSQTSSPSVEEGKSWWFRSSTSFIRRTLDFLKTEEKRVTHTKVEDSKTQRREEEEEKEGAGETPSMSPVTAAFSRCSLGGREGGGSGGTSAALRKEETEEASSEDTSFIPGGGLAATGGDGRDLFSSKHEKNAPGIIYQKDSSVSSSGVVPEWKTPGAASERGGGGIEGARCPCKKEATRDRGARSAADLTDEECIAGARETDVHRQCTDREREGAKVVVESVQHHPAYHSPSSSSLVTDHEKNGGKRPSGKRQDAHRYPNGTEPVPDVTEFIEKDILFWQVCVCCKRVVVPCRHLGRVGNLPFSKFVDLLLSDETHRGDGLCEVLPLSALPLHTQTERKEAGQGRKKTRRRKPKRQMTMKSISPRALSREMRRGGRHNLIESEGGGGGAGCHSSSYSSTARWKESGAVCTPGEINRVSEKTDEAGKQLSLDGAGREEGPRRLRRERAARRKSGSEHIDDAEYTAMEAGGAMEEQENLRTNSEGRSERRTKRERLLVPFGGDLPTEDDMAAGVCSHLVFRERTFYFAFAGVVSCPAYNRGRPY